MLKLSNWEYLKLFLIFTIISSVFIMRNYNEYREKGVFNLNEFEMESNINTTKCNLYCFINKILSVVIKIALKNVKLIIN